MPSASSGGSGGGAIKAYVPGAPLTIAKPAPAPAAPAAPPISGAPAASVPSPGTSTDLSLSDTLVSARDDAGKRRPLTLPRVIGIGAGFALAVGGILWFTTRGGATAQGIPTGLEVAANEGAGMPPAASPTAPALQAEPQKSAEAALSAAPSANEKSTDPSSKKKGSKAELASKPEATSKPEAASKPEVASKPAKATVAKTSTPAQAATSAPASEGPKPAFKFTFEQ